MRIALIGYGKMGHAIERIAQERGHEIVSRVDLTTNDKIGDEAFRRAEVAIEFTTPKTAEVNIRKCWECHMPVVSGTTGWSERLPELKKELESNGETLMWASNYSIGVNLLFILNEQLAKLMKGYPQYIPTISEVHHIHKLDAPSGTAKTLADAVGVGYEKVEWKREGEVAGIHEVSWESAVDTLTLRHDAKSRDGFALGAVMAAEWLVGKKGWHEVRELILDKDHFAD